MARIYIRNQRPDLLPVRRARALYVPVVGACAIVLAPPADHPASRAQSSRLRELACAALRRVRSVPHKLDDDVHTVVRARRPRMRAAIIAKSEIFAAPP